MSWDDWSASNASPVAENDKWHVALAPDEVKIVSLEQLDDLFRLSIVDAETKVWQAGMREWQPLRIIAGIEDEPEPPPAPRRTHPRPPSPRPVPPAPRPVALAAVPQVPASHYPAPASHYPAPASFYPATVSAVPAPAATSFAAPITMQPQSVRPLVVSYAPAGRQRGGGFGRFLVGLAVLAGVGISLYRNDVLRDAAHSVHQDALYARLEGALGGPAFGTLRAGEQSAAALSAPLAHDGVVSPALHPASDTTTASALAVSAPAAATPAVPAGTTPPVVSLESLAPEKKALAVSAPTPVAPVAAPPVRAAVAPPSVARAAVVPVKSAPATAKVAKPAPAPVPEKSESQMSEREKLNAAIGRSMMSSPLPSSKSKSKASEYDPLNPKL